jgi:hypothetical protein
MSGTVQNSAGRILEGLLWLREWWPVMLLAMLAAAYLAVSWVLAAEAGRVRRPVGSADLLP